MASMAPRAGAVRSAPAGAGGTNWRATLRRSALRAGQLAASVALFAFTGFLAIALMSYQQTDPSLSTAAGEVVGNWMGAPGAFVADFVLSLFGLVAILLLPLCYVYARRLWRDADGAPFAEDTDFAPHGARSAVLLLVAMVLFATVLSLVSTPREWDLPASTGGLVGLLGESGVRALAGQLPEVWRFWAILALGLLCLAGGAVLGARVFTLDWAGLLTLPEWMRHPPQFALRDARTPRMRAQNLDDDSNEDADEPSTAAALADGAAAPARRRAPEITDPATAPRRALSAKPAQQDLFATYALPSIELLSEMPAAAVPKLDKTALERNARLLETVLDDFNVKGEITAVRTGPVVTMYEFEPAPGIKSSRVVGLADDVARNMSAVSARIATIPGKSVMGIELPNANRQMVSFRELVAAEAFAGSKGNLPIILGKDIAGEPIMADLAAMPHLLVAGTTGSGKSVGLNCILVSLLYRFGPDQCRMILIDPKVLELKSYDNIPHLLAPVVTEPAKAIRALKWAVEEMERRYRMMSELNVRNLSGFNDKVRTAAAKGKPLKRTVQTGFDPDTGTPLIEEEALDYPVLPQIVVIVDELADLMLVVGKEIEGLIQRLCQKSRAAGIHLIVATQRPSVDVITGVIKANLPSRISFAVQSRIDSRTIIGEQGAEQLLGKGDMLYKPNAGSLMRVHGPFVSDEEVEAVAQHWRDQGEPAYVDNVTEEVDDGGYGYGYSDEMTASDDPDERKYRQACQIVFENQKASGSWLQRQMGVGYNTAAKWIERMEGDGFVGPANHVGRREIYRDRDGNPL